MQITVQTMRPVYTISLDSEFATITEYSSANPFADILTHVLLWDEIGNEVNDAAEKAKITCTWKVKAPINADFYYYDVVYAGKDGVYASSQASISVEITPMELTLATADATTLTVPEAMTMPEVLSKVTYKVLHKEKKADGTRGCLCVLRVPFYVIIAFCGIICYLTYDKRLQKGVHRKLAAMFACTRQIFIVR